MRLHLRTLLLPGASLLAACSAGAPPAPPPNGPPASATSAAAAAPGPEAASAARNRACEDCHRDIAAEWRGSLHHRSWDDPVFLTAYAIEPVAFCRGCHVPEADPRNETPPEPARRLGIGCVTCHVRDGEIVGVRAVSASETAGTAPAAVSASGWQGAAPAAVGPPEGRHAVVGDALFATEAACARCHEFPFPEPQEALMQGTIEEHASSRNAGAPCRDCHMPLVPGEGQSPHRSHDFRVIGNTPLLRSALTARAARSAEEPDAVVVTLAADRIGHAFPTGDMFRRLEVRARALPAAPPDGDGSPPLAAPAVVLARTFLMMPGPKGALRRQTGDDRLPSSGEPIDVELVFPAPIAARAVRWEVVYQRMDAAMAEMFGIDPAADEVIVSEGVLPASGRPAIAPAADKPAGAGAGPPGRPAPPSPTTTARKP